MAFCTTCGASVTGAFCNQCGTPARGAAAPAPPPIAQSVPGAARVKRGLGPVGWILIVLGCLIGVVIVGAVGTGIFVMNKARQAGVDMDLFQTNPGLAIGKLIAATNPEIEVVRTNPGSGTITLRNRNTGKETTVSFEDARHGRFRFTAKDESGKTSTVEIGEGGKLPLWVPEYPNAGAGKPGVIVRGESSDGGGEGGTFTFTTSDPAEKVLSFYQRKAEGLGMKVELKATSPSGGGTIVGVDEEGERTLTAVVADGNPTTVNLTFSRKH